MSPPRLPPHARFTHHSAVPASRRGVVYLISALILVAFALTILFARTPATQLERSMSIQERIRTLDGFLRDLDADVPRAAYIAGYRALLAMEQYVSERGYVPHPEPLLREAFLNGTLDGDAYPVLENSSFQLYLARAQRTAQDVGIRLTITLNDVTLRQDTPWSITAQLNMSFNVTDKDGLARWDYTATIPAEISILGTRDPVYIVGTLGRVPNTFRKSPYSNDEMVDGNDTTVLYNETAAMYYREDPHAPSYLQRLAGNLTGTSKNGISSLVNLDALNTQGLLIKTYTSIVDNIYFSNQTPTIWCPDPAAGSPLQTWFQLDDEHYHDPDHNYELDDLNASIC